MASADFEENNKEVQRICRKYITGPLWWKPQAVARQIYLKPELRAEIQNGELIIPIEKKPSGSNYDSIFAYSNDKVSDLFPTSGIHPSRQSKTSSADEDATKWLDAIIQSTVPDTESLIDKAETHPDPKGYIMTLNRVEFAEICKLFDRANENGLVDGYYLGKADNKPPGFVKFLLKWCLPLNIAAVLPETEFGKSGVIPDCLLEEHDGRRNNCLFTC